MKSLNHLGPEELQVLKPTRRRADRGTGVQTNPKKGIKPRPCLRCDELFNTTIYFRVCGRCTDINNLIGSENAESFYTSSGRVGIDAHDK